MFRNTKNVVLEGIEDLGYTIDGISQQIDEDAQGMLADAKNALKNPRRAVGNLGYAVKGGTVGHTATEKMKHTVEETLADANDAANRVIKKVEEFVEKCKQVSPSQKLVEGLKKLDKAIGKLMDAEAKDPQFTTMVRERLKELSTSVRELVSAFTARLSGSEKTAQHRSNVTPSSSKKNPVQAAMREKYPPKPR